MGRLSDEMNNAAKLQLNEDGGKPPNTARHLKLVRLIQVTQSFRGFPPLETKEAARQAIIWDQFGLHAIPDDSFADVFIRALETLEDGTNFGAPHILTAWNSIKRERAAARAAELQAKGMRYQETGITFAQWFDHDRDWIEKNLDARTQAMMKEIFEKRTGGEPVDQTPPPSKDCFVPPPPEGSQYCRKCAQLTGLYWDVHIGKYRCCECDGGRAKAAGIWNRKGK